MQNKWFLIFFMFFLLLTIIKIYVVNSKAFSRCGRLTMNERFNMIDLNNGRGGHFHNTS